MSSTTMLTTVAYARPFPSLMSNRTCQLVYCVPRLATVPLHMFVQMVFGGSTFERTTYEQTWQTTPQHIDIIAAT